MDISLNEMNSVDKITLECLMNPQHYDKYIETHDSNAIKIRVKERKFYKRRIIALTREMLKGNYPNNEIERDDALLIVDEAISRATQFYSYV